MPPMSSGYGGASVDEPCYVLYSMASSPGSWHCMSVEVIEMAGECGFVLYVLWGVTRVSDMLLLQSVTY